MYDTLGTILWKYSETATISPHAVVRHASATMMPNKYFPNEPNPVEAIVVNKYVPMFRSLISIDLTSCHLLAYDYQYNPNEIYMKIKATAAIKPAVKVCLNI